MSDYLFRSAIPVIVAAIMLSGCGKSDEPDPPRHPRPEPSETVARTQSVEFALEIGRFTPAAYDKLTLPADIHVAVANDSMTYDYRYDGTGKLKSNIPVKVTEGKPAMKIKAWYIPGSGTGISQLPRRWTLQSDQTDGYDEGMLLFGHTSLSYGGPYTLTLRQQTARVDFNIRFEGSAAPYQSITTMQVGNSDIAMSGSIALTGDSLVWTPDPAVGTIWPLITTAPEGYAAACSALLVPQSVGGTTLLTVTLSDGSTLPWKAPEGTTLLPGSYTRFDATVSADLKSLRVTCADAAMWEEGENLDITSRPEIVDYGPVKIGDYYYSDGSWSDGGFEGFSSEGHGKVIWKSPRPQPTYTNPVTGALRSVIGIVFTTDPDRIGEAERSDLKSKGVDPHGLVICSSVIASTQWDRASNDETLIGIPDVAGAPGHPLYPLANASISGLDVCRKIFTGHPRQIAEGNYRAVTDTRALAAPSASTGWFVPAAGQWFDMLRNFTGMDMTDQAPFYFISNQFEAEDGTHFDWQTDMTLAMQAEYTENFVELLNYPFSTLVAAQHTDFATNDAFITATMCNADYMYYTNVLPKFITFRRALKDYWIKVRPILAF